MLEHGLLALGQGSMSCAGECYFGVMYVEWYGVCDYGGVHVHHICFDLCAVYGIGVCFNDCGVVCVVIRFLRLGVVCYVVV